MANSNTDKGKYEAELKIEVQRQLIKNRKLFSLSTPDTQLFDISANKTRDLSIKITFKNSIFTRYRTLLFVDTTN